MEKAIVIPSLNPTSHIIELVVALRKVYGDVIIVVNDGSDTSSINYFHELEISQGCMILNHDKNYGKGRALKTAFSYIQEHLPDVSFCITVDGDGQHLPKDIIRCIEAAYDHDVVLGVRTFSKEVPWKSRFGNILTRNMLRVFTGVSISDSQTGLRILSRKAMNAVMDVPGERYEFETNMLIELHKQGYQFLEVSIDTVYFDENAGSHFNPILDSWRIYKEFIKFIVSSLSASLVDLGVFKLVLSRFSSNSLHSIGIATFVARFVSSLYNYKVNQKLIFKQSSKATVYKYFTLVVVQFVVSSVVVTLLDSVFPNTNTTLLKLCVDSGIFVINYVIQKKYIFVDDKHEN